MFWVSFLKAKAGNISSHVLVKVKFQIGESEVADV